MPNQSVNVCLIGNKFMGRAHSNAFLKVNRFFTKLPKQAVMHTVVGRTQILADGAHSVVISAYKSEGLAFLSDSSLLIGK